MRAPILAVLVLSLVLCASAQNWNGNGNWRENGNWRGKHAFSFFGCKRLASAGEAHQVAKQIEGRAKKLRRAHGHGGGGRSSRALGRLRGFRRGTRAEATRALRERSSAIRGSGDVPTTDRMDGVARQSGYSSSHKSWREAFDTVQSDRWWFAGPWANGGIFGNGFEPKFFSNDESQLTLPITKDEFANSDSAASGVQGKTYSFTGSEIRSQTVDYGFGCYSWCIRPTRTSGIVSSLYLYSAGIWDTPWEGVSVPHREIDIEFIVSNGKVTMQSNMVRTSGGNSFCSCSSLIWSTTCTKTDYRSPFTDILQFNDPDWKSGNQKTFEELHQIPSSEFHTYSFKWHTNYIQWYIDGVAVRKIEHQNDSIPQESQQTMRLMMNSYAVDPDNADVVNWAGAVPSDFTDDASLINWFRFEKGSSCAPETECNAVG